ncbi:MAG: hypothetical protein R3B09_14095 [Nannocystaceae bacterium]
MRDDESTSDTPEASDAEAPESATETSAEPTPDPDAEARRQIRDRLGDLVDAGTISIYEYNLRKKALEAGRLDAAEVPLAEIGGEAAEPGLTKKPSAWGAAAPKRWTSPEGRGDDPTVRVVHSPLQPGIGDGKVFLFLWGLKRTRDIDQQMLARELEGIVDDIEVLRGAGYTVVVDPQATKEDFVDAIRGEGEGVKGLVPAGILWSAHGYEDGAIETCDGGSIRPADIDGSTVSPGLRLMIFSACYTGSRSSTWRKALGGRPLVVGWGRPVTIDRAVAFLTPDPNTDTDLDDLIARYLLQDTPLPGEENDGYSPLEAAQGRLADLPERAERVSELLQARWRTTERAVEMAVPLPEHRRQLVEAFVVDSGAPFNEGEPLLAVRSTVGELSEVVNPTHLLNHVAAPGYARVALVRGEGDAPNIVVQGFLPLSRVRDRDLAALIYEVAAMADSLEHAIFGGDMR